MSLSRPKVGLSSGIKECDCAWIKGLFKYTPSVLILNRRRQRPQYFDSITNTSVSLLSQRPCENNNNTKKNHSHQATAAVYERTCCCLWWWRNKRYRSEWKDVSDSNKQQQQQIREDGSSPTRWHSTSAADVIDFNHGRSYLSALFIPCVHKVECHCWS